MAETVQNRIQPPANMSHHMKHIIEADVRLTKTRTVDTQSQTVQTQTMLNGLKEAVLLDGDRGRTLAMEPMKQEVNTAGDLSIGVHMVQNQLSPSYPQFTQTGLEGHEYQQPGVATSTSVSDPSQVAPQFKDGQIYTTTTATVPGVTSNGVEQQTTEIASSEPPATSQSPSASAVSGPKRLHVSNIPFRFREADLRQLLGFGPILDVEIIFNERGSKGFGFVTFATSADADRAREKLNGTVVEGRKIEINNATARVMTKKPVTTPTCTIPTDFGIPDMGISAAAVLRGAAIRGGRARAVLPTAAAAAAFRHPAAALQQAAAPGLPYTLYQDPFLATAAYAAEARYQPYAAGYAAAATRYAIPTVATAATYAATAGGAVLPSYAREYATPEAYLGPSIGPLASYGVSPAAVYRGGYQRFTPY